MKGYNAVQYDRQWIRRVMREEKTLIEAFNEEPAQKIDDINHYGNYTYGRAYPSNPVNNNNKNYDNAASGKNNK